MSMMGFNPSIYDDLAAGSMNMMAPPVCNPFMGGMYPTTSYLGGTTLQPQLDHDKFQVMKAKDAKDKGVFYKAMAVLGVMATIGFMRFGKNKTAIGSPGLFKGIGAAMLYPFKMLGKGAVGVGKGIAYPFKMLGKGIGKLFHWKRTPSP